MSKRVIKRAPNRQHLIDIVGRSCRLPGANNVSEFWNNLRDGHCSVTQVDPDRFTLAPYKNPRRGEKGKAYTFAAGVLDDVWGFDPAVFAISPREAVQMDPQQRLLLMLVWEALEDAGLPPSSLKGRDVGVYVGNSAVDHNNRFFFDPAGTDSYMMTGNTGALVSNRISYIFDLHGPSMTIDTACSSSLVALDQAVNALRSGRIDMAIVGGVNMLMSPFPFVGFSAASMLSEQGLCRPFDKDAYGYVRAEGGVVMLLQRANDESYEPKHCHAQIVETGTNSDGRTVGVALPSADYQAKLLTSVYDRARVNPQDLVFVEAHGTGTRVGDPAETQSIGQVLGQTRSKPLPIGSVKSNVGHLEPASGIVGLLKATLALEHNQFPASLHLDTLNPDIAFDTLNLEVAQKPVELKRQKRRRYAGVNSFGFGGTNVHIVLTDPAVIKKVNPDDRRFEGSHYTLLLSANCQGALKDMATAYARQIKQCDEQNLADLINAVAWQRERLGERLVVFADSAKQLIDGLKAYVSDIAAPNVVCGKALAKELPTALVYSGNGSQWAGMGRNAYTHNKQFAATFGKIDRLFTKHSGWSLRDALFAKDLTEQLNQTRIAQPLLFAVQVALSETLKTLGLKINAVLGHSVGEVAAAHASGALSLKDAVHIIFARSEHQESVSGKGLMAAVMLPEQEVHDILADNDDFDAVEISACNSARSVTVSGPVEQINAFVQYATRHNIIHKLLAINYPFHHGLLDPVKGKLIQDLADIKPRNPKLSYYSTVTGDKLEGRALGAEYWWHNIRKPVRFNEAVMAAARDGSRLFMEIGPKPVLRSYLAEITGDLDTSFNITNSFTANDSDDIDPVKVIFARAITSGACFDEAVTFGPERKVHVDLPLYPWQNKPYKLTPSSEALEAFVLTVPPHPLLGKQLRQGEYVWSADLDTQLLPFLSDHKVDGKVILPGAAFAEMALSVGMQWLQNDRIEVRDMDIVAAMTLSDDYAMQVRTRLNVESSTVEISSRKRLTDDDWQIHAKCRVATIPGDAVPNLHAPDLCAGDDPNVVARLYNLAKQHGIEFGPHFQRMVRCEEVENDVIEVVLDERDKVLDVTDGESASYLLHPLDLDACFHGLNTLYDKLDLGFDKLAFIPVRLGTLRVYQPDTAARSARIHILSSNRRGGQADFELFDAQGQVVATLSDARFRAAELVKRHTMEKTAYSFTYQLKPLADQCHLSAAPAIDEVIAALETAPSKQVEKTEEQHLLLDAAARRAAYDMLVLLTDNHGKIDIDTMMSTQEDNKANNQKLAIIASLATIAEQSDMAKPDGNNWQLSHHCPLPPSSDLMQTLLGENPCWLAECVLLNRATSLLPELLLGQTSDDDDTSPQPEIYSPAMMEQLNSSSPLAGMHIDQIMVALEQIIANWPQNKPLRILELGVGGGALTRRLLPLVEAHHGQLIAADSDETSLSRLKMSLADSVFFDTATLEGNGENLKSTGPFDLVVSANSLHRLRDSAALMKNAALNLAQGGAAIISTTSPDAFHDLVFGLTSDWFDWEISPLFPLNPMKQAQRWVEIFQHGGLKQVSHLPLLEGLEGSSIIVGMRSETKSLCDADTATLTDDLKTDNPDNDDLPDRKLIIAASAPETGFAEDLLAKSGACDLFDYEPAIIAPDLTKTNGSSHECWSRLTRQLERYHLTAKSQHPVIDIVHLVGAFDDTTDPMAELSQRIKSLTTLLQDANTLGMNATDTRAGDTSAADTSAVDTAIVNANIRLWIVAPGGARALTNVGSPCPVQTGVWAFGRTAINEYGDIDIRLVDFAEQLSLSEAADRLFAFLTDPGDETETVLTRNGLQALRVKRGLPDNLSPSQHLPSQHLNETPAIVLSRPSSGTLDGLKWQPLDLRLLEDDEVRIKVAVTGLNFRDVMWAQGLLPEEALDNGFAGPTLGFECSGLITAIGNKVTNLKVGDRVMALAPACFSSHVTVTQNAVVELPQSIDFTAGASIPVAFLTAYYSLHHLAHLEEGEWVLIHGAAGGVGLAALQVAKWLRAKVIATAGSDEKRQFLKMMGADHVLDTRSLDFVDQVRDITACDRQSGVDVVLNSLAGEAMERSLELVRPFGRFLELGKRDFYGNTKIGLRPFKSNLSYFGIDADQLLNHQPRLSKRLFGELMELFKSGRFTPLGYRLFDAGNVLEAFRLMQQSGHIGKIVVKAPVDQLLTANTSDGVFEASDDGVHIIFGGLGGFGLEAAVWLADHGARSIILTSRSGSVTEQGEQTLARLAKMEVTVTIEKCDVADEKATIDLLTRVRRDHAIKGIMHTAMVLDDELIQNLTDKQIDDVLRPKVQGADILDRATRVDDLDYFVLFSSAAVLFGNPGQAHYVAANAWLDGLAHKRRLQGLPALAVGWGAITDVGVLARQLDTAKSLARHTGGVEFKARQGLELLARLLANGDGKANYSANYPSVTLAAMNWSFAGKTLPIMHKPAFTLMARQASSNKQSVENVDIAGLIEGLDDSEAQLAIAQLLAQEVSAIFRMPVEEINLKRSLVELGMDSLMGMELRTAAEVKLGIDLPMASIGDGTTINDMAVKVLMRVRSRKTADDEVSAGTQDLARQHLGETVDDSTLKKIDAKVKRQDNLASTAP